MAAPAQLRNQLSAFLDGAWDALQGGTWGDRENFQRTEQIVIAGRTLNVTVRGEGDEGYPRIIIMVKRLP